MKKNCNLGTIAFWLWVLLLVSFLAMHVRFAITPIHLYLETTQSEACPEGTTDQGNWCYKKDEDSWFGHYIWKDNILVTTIAGEDTGFAIYWK